jgi:hypothetical protein
MVRSNWQLRHSRWKIKEGSPVWISIWKNFELVFLPSLSAAWDGNIWRPLEKIAKTVILFGSSLQPCYRLADSHDTQASRKLWTKWNDQSITESVVACRAIGIPRLRVKTILDHRHFYCNKMRMTTLVCIHPVNQQWSRVQLPNDTYNLGWCQMWSSKKSAHTHTWVHEKRGGRCYRHGRSNGGPNRQPR